MFHPKMKYVYVGLDSHKDTHTAVFLNCFYEKLGELTFKNVPNEFPKFLSESKKFKSNELSFLWGFEDVSSYGRALAVFLTNKKEQVKHVNASLVANERKSVNVLQKTDSFDAECAARVLLSRFDQLPDFNPQDKYWVLSQLVVRRRSIVKGNKSLKNHLQAYITSHYPSHGKFFKDIDAKSSLAFYEKYPSPEKLDNVSVEELAAFLKENGHCNKSIEKATLILDCVKRDGDTLTDFQDIRNQAVISTINQIRNNKKEMESVECLIKDFLKNFDYKLESMRGIDFVTASNLITEIGDIERFPTPAKLAKYSGISPVTYASGKSSVQYANERGNRELNAIFFNLAISVICTAGKNKRIVNHYFYDYYHKKIKEGKTKRQSLKCVERKLVNIIWKMMKYKTEYRNPETKAFEEDTPEAANK